MLVMMSVGNCTTTIPMASHLGNTIEEKTRRILGWTDDYTPTCAPPTITSNFPIAAKPSPGRKDRTRKPSRTGQNGVSIATTPYPYSLLNPNGRQRKTSSSSSVSSESSILRQQLTPPPSPGSDSSRLQAPMRKGSIQDSFGPFPVSPVSPNTPNPNGFLPVNVIEPKVADTQVFDRLRRLLPNLPSDKNAYQVLVQTVSNVIDLEHQLQQVKEKKREVRNMLQSQRTSNGFNPVIGAPIVGQQMTYTSWGAEVPDDLMHVDVSAFKCMVSSNEAQMVNTHTMVSSNWSDTHSLDSMDLFTGLDPLTVDTSL